MGSLGQALANRAGAALRRAVDAVLPPLCLVCHAPVADPSSLCPACWLMMPFLAAPLCARCGTPLPEDLPGAVPAGSICAACHAQPPRFDHARAALAYDDTSRPLVLAYKHADRLDLAPLFARWLIQAGPELVAEADCVVPVPLHRWRLLRRQYNQSALLAQAVAKATGKRYLATTLIRARATPSQAGLRRGARQRNVAGAFRVDRPDAIAGRAVLLIDDVHTTGATLDACAGVLKRAGARRVDALTIARVV